LIKSSKVILLTIILIDYKTKSILKKQTKKKKYGLTVKNIKYKLSKLKLKLKTNYLRNNSD